MSRELAEIAVPKGFRAKYGRRKDFHLECRTEACEWEGPAERWISPARRDVGDLVRFAQSHANRWHPIDPQVIDSRLELTTQRVYR